MDAKPNFAEATRFDADAVYTDGQLRLLLGLTSATLGRARRNGKLRYSRQGHRILYRGSWILSWLDGDARPIGKGGRHAS